MRWVILIGVLAIVGCGGSSAPSAPTPSSTVPVTPGDGKKDGNVKFN